MYRYFYLFLSLIFVLNSCDFLKDKSKQAINKTGEVAGKTATEFVEGVGHGIDESLSLTIDLSEELLSAGLETGAYLTESRNEGTDNVLSLYVIFNNDFSDTLSVKVFNKDGLEMGRTKTMVEGKKGTAAYFDFEFDKRTNIESKGKVTVNSDQ